MQRIKDGYFQHIIRINIKIKWDALELKKCIYKFKNSRNVFNSTLDIIKTLSENLKTGKYSNWRTQRKKIERTELSINEYEKKISCRTWANVCITGISEEEKKDRQYLKRYRWEFFQTWWEASTRDPRISANSKKDKWQETIYGKTYLKCSKTNREIF